MLSITSAWHVILPIIMAQRETLEKMFSLRMINLAILRYFKILDYFNTFTLIFYKFLVFQETITRILDKANSDITSKFSKSTCCAMLFRMPPELYRWISCSDAHRCVFQLILIQKLVRVKNAKQKYMLKRSLKVIFGSIFVILAVLLSF